MPESEGYATGSGRAAIYLGGSSIDNSADVIMSGRQATAFWNLSFNSWRCKR
ncbi:MAG: hypothetical protein IPL67_08945 [Ignavibacteria bacterium]|nr:hypothetical protein [Ignavibacteria bacterium]